MQVVHVSDWKDTDIVRNTFQMKPRMRKESVSGWRRNTNIERWTQRRPSTTTQPNGNPSEPDYWMKDQYVRCAVWISVQKFTILGGIIGMTMTSMMNQWSGVFARNVTPR